MKTLCIAAVLAALLACPLAAEEWYIVQKSDTLWSISRKFGLKVEDIRRQNGLKGDHIQVGQRLRVPSVSGQKSAPKPQQTGVNQSAGTIRHTVVSGESLWSISRRYGVSIENVQRDNALKKDTIYKGQVLLVRGASRQSNTASAVTTADRKFLWPIHGTVVEKFGVQQKGIINGITIAAKKEAEVRAAASGVVTYTGPLRGYGQVVIIRHDGLYYSVYANLSQVWAEEGNTINARSPVGKAGFVQSAGCYGVHFQLYRQSSAVNPLSYLAG
ncbi:MAG: LysM peptidoglycan-binding domain-containing protein [Spirochaetota bacterium]|jgi:murein DD-endopeptidase MepM/ murein hydrolase activator NlpD|nr:LysM peptidoglycan-binding domain-containing protein [Spirochaetota bacterium]